MDVASLFDVKDKVVLITGGGRGIGRMIASGFVANGARVYIASRDASALSATAAELNGGGPGTCTALPFDAMQASECARLARELSVVHGEERLHVLVNNSGASFTGGVDDFPDEQWDRLLRLNLQRVFTLTQCMLPLLEAAGAEEGASGGGDGGGGGVGGAGKGGPAAVINIGSINAMSVSSSGNFSYAASKAGLHHLTRHLSQVLGPRGITVNTVACGPFETQMTTNTFKHFREGLEESNPMGRTGRPGDMAGCCLFLASRAGSYVNGSTINADGGLHLSPKM
ncbi:short chain dehydrogenase/reductase family [Xylariaceae sp. FL0804]|nr:short chain dehydrogenase/reductase family [Xylariaceae sp. FL0804]